MATDTLFQPLRAGALELPNRIVMAPLTRSRAGDGNVPTPLNAEYYVQRASAGLIVTEASQVSPLGQGYAWTPGIHSAAQVEGWKRVTDAVHARGGRIVLQLWHVGRISHPALHGQTPVAPSAIRARNTTSFIVDAQGPRQAPTAEPRALTLAEIADVVADYAQAARNAKVAGFDGVEVHGANGYLLDQFLQSGSNVRTDAYGGSVARRARLLLEVVDAVADVWGRERVGVRLSPLGSFGDMHDDTPEETFGYAVAELDRRGLAYLHLIDPAGTGAADADTAARMLAHLRTRWRGALILAAGQTAASAAAAIEAGRAELVAFGRAFIANPDLPARIRRDAPLNEPDPSTFYGGGAEGYTDYPALGAA